MRPTPELVSRIVTGLLIAAAIVAPVLLRVPAPYGRHRRPGFGPEMPARVGWVLMELPALLVPALAFVLADGPQRAVPAAWLLLGLWLLHYGQRALLFPLLMRGRRPRAPLLTVGLAVLFNVLNGTANGASLAWMPAPPAGRLAAGVTCFGVGLAINLHADHVLRGLRGPGESGYRIPHGGAFRWVSAANYLGELIEWVGFALAAMTPAAWAFAAFTAANLVPRALSHHRWYRATFPDYPPERKAVVPGVL
jgi:hypothetical protein